MRSTPVVGLGGGDRHNVQPHGEMRRNSKLLLTSLVGCIFCTASVAPYAIGSFVKPLEVAFGWSRAEVTAALLFSQALTALGAIITGILIERFGARRIALSGFVGTGLGFLLASQADSLPFFYTSFGIAALLGAGSGFITWSRAITGHFDKQRGMALAIILSGSGIAAFVLPPMLSALIGTYGWRAGFVVLAYAPVLIAVPLTFLLFRPVEKPIALNPVANPTAAEMTGLTAREAARSYRFWVLLFSILALYLGISGIIPNLIPSLTDDGLTTTSAALAQSALGAAIIGGRLTVGWLVDRFWAPAVAAVVLTLPVIGCLLLMSEPGVLTAIIAASLVGMAAGAELDVLALLISRYFGVRHFARIYGFLFAVVALSGGLGPMAFASLYDLTGSYDVSFSIVAVLFGFGGPILLVLGPYPKFDQAATVEGSACGNRNPDGFRPS